VPFGEMILGQLVSLGVRTHDGRPVLSDGPGALFTAQAQARALALRTAAREPRPDQE
jgi:hypothetical protein